MKRLTILLVFFIFYFSFYSICFGESKKKPNLDTIQSGNKEAPKELIKELGKEPPLNIGRYQIISVEYKKDNVSSTGAGNELIKAVIKLDTSTGETWILKESSVVFHGENNEIEKYYSNRSWGKLEIETEMVRDPKSKKLIIRDIK